MSSGRTRAAVAVLALVAVVGGTAGIGSATVVFERKWGTLGTGDGQLNAPSAVAVDAAGSVYVADTANNRIQKFNSAGAFLTQWGSFGSGDGQFNLPRGVAVDAAGYVYVADTFNDRIQKFTSAGVFVTTWGTSGSGDGQFAGPRGVAVDSAGNVYVADTDNDRIQKFTSTGVFVTKWGSFFSGSGNGQFDNPVGIAVDGADNVYVADVNNDRIQKFTSTGTFVAKWGTFGSGDGQLNLPRGVAVAGAGSVYVADTGNHRIQKFEQSGSITVVTNSVPDHAQDFLFTLGFGAFALDDDDSDPGLPRSITFSGLQPGSVAVTQSATSGWPLTSLVCDTGETIDLANRRANISLGLGEDVTCTFTNTQFASQLSHPEGLAVDAAGNVYIADNFNHRIQKFTSTGTFVTKWGTQGFGDGQFNDPSDVAVDAAGNVYVSDSNNHRIQKFTSAGGFLTKWGTAGDDAGQFNNPLSVAVDAAGNVYVVDTLNRVQKFTSAGVFVTTWGSFGSGDGQFDSARGVAVDAAGRVYVADRNNHRIQKFTSTGGFLTKWGTEGTGDGQLRFPLGVAVDAAGRVYVADTANIRIQKFTNTGGYLAKFGTPGSGDGSSFSSDGELAGPHDVAVDAAGNVYVSDNFNDQIQKFVQFSSIKVVTNSVPDHAQDFVFTLGSSVFALDDDSDPGLDRSITFSGLQPGSLVVTQSATSGWQLTSLVCDTGETIDLANRRATISLGPAEDVTCTFTNTQLATFGSGLAGPSGVAVDAAGSVYVADTGNDRIVKFTSAGVYLTAWGTEGSGDGQFSVPRGVAVDAAGNVYVADGGNHRIQKFTSAGTFVTKWGVSGTADGEFNAPRSVAVDADGNVYVADTLNHRVQKFTDTGTFVTTWGTEGSGDGELNNPRGVAVDAAGNVYVAEQLNHRIQKFTDTGAFVTKWGTLGTGNGQLTNPGGVAVDAAGRVYVADTSPDRIQKFTDTGAFVTKWGSLGTGNGQYNNPLGVAVDAAGSVYVADTNNNRIQKFDQTGSITVVTDSVNDHPQDFVFTLGSSVFALDDDSDPGLDRSITFSELEPGSLAVTQSAVSGWQLTSLVCDTGETIDLVNRRAIISVGPGEDVTCTFTNTQLAPLGTGEFTFPRGIAVDAAGNVYVADSSNDRIQKFNSAGAFVTAWGTSGTGNGQFSTPLGVAVDAAGNVYVADGSNNRIQKFTRAGTFVTKWGTSGAGDGQFNAPVGVAVDTTGSVYVADSNNHRIQKFTDTGGFVTAWGTSGGIFVELTNPRGVAVDAAGNVYVADTNNNRIQKFTDTGGFVTSWGGFGGGDGQFNAPAGVAVDAAGRVYVADSGNDRIQKFTGTGTFLTKWGTPNDGGGVSDFSAFAGTPAGPGNLLAPNAVAVDAAATVYVADTGNNRIQKFEQAGSITVVIDSVNDHAQDFVFTLGPSVFALDDDADAALSNEVTFDGMARGTYVVRGAPALGWGLTSLVCDSGETIDLAKRRAIISLELGDDVTCTFTNSQFGTITVVEDALPNDAQDFAFTGGLGPFSLDDDSNATLPRQQSFSKPPGTYAVTETAPPAGWSLTKLSCTPGGPGNLATRTATVTLAPGGSSVCTYTNAKELRPDGRVATALAGPYAGDNIYNNTGDNQTKTRTVARNAAGTYFVKIQNDSPLFTDSFRLTGTATSAGFTVRYFNATTGAAMTNVGISSSNTPALAPGAVFTVKITVTVSATAAHGAKKNVLLEAQSVGRLTERDIIKTITTVA